MAVRATQQVIEVAELPASPDVRASQLVLEVAFLNAAATPAHVRASQLVLEVAFVNRRGGFISPGVFPGVILGGA